MAASNGALEKPNGTHAEKPEDVDENNGGGIQANQ
jgi:hypothetical protein